MHLNFFVTLAKTWIYVELCLAANFMHRYLGQDGTRRKNMKECQTGYSYYIYQKWIGPGSLFRSNLGHFLTSKFLGFSLNIIYGVVRTL